MLELAKLTVGEIYSYGGRRARLDKIGQTPEGYIEVVISYGRSFDRSSVLTGSPWSPDRPRDLNETWVGFKERKKLARERWQQLDNLSQRASDASQLLGLKSAYVDRSGSVHLYGDAAALTALVEAMEEKSRQGHSSDISDLI